MNFDKLRDLMNHFVEANHAPGNTVSVYLDQKKVFEYSCGYADVEKRLPMTGKEHFFLYSCSKIATVPAALQLLERGEFLLTDPLYEYIPEFRQMYVKGEDGTLTAATKSIRILDLFNMTAGLTYNFNTDVFKKAESALKCDGLTVENEYIKVTFNEVTGGISSIINKADSAEILGAESCVPTVIDNSEPDTWAHNIFKFDKTIAAMKLESIEVVENGDARIVVKRETYEMVAACDI